MKKLVLIACLCISMIFSCITVYATDATTEYNIEKTTIREVNTIASDIVYAVLTKNTTTLSSYISLFEYDAYTNLYDYTLNYDNSHVKSVIFTLTDFTYPENSSTGDTVIMANSKIEYDNGYFGMYLFEFHVDRHGKIYGYNIWIY